MLILKQCITSGGTVLYADVNNLFENYIQNDKLTRAHHVSENSHAQTRVNSVSY
jgi:hypothetical protein